MLHWMKNRTMLLAWALIALIGATSVDTSAVAQSVLFDFDAAPIHTPLPIDLTAGGITAHFSATGQGFSIQAANTLGFTPPGFSGNCLYPSSVFSSDLVISFSRALTNFSILYSPQELGCDDSARMKVTAFMDGTPVGTNTAIASTPGTWPSETLGIATTQGFNNVIVHYDAPPPTCRDYGVIFLADNMSVTPAPEPPSLRISRSGDQIQLSWPADATAFSLQSNTNLQNPNSWRVITNTPTVTGGNKAVGLPLEAWDSFFRLRSP